MLYLKGDNGLSSVASFCPPPQKKKPKKTTDCSTHICSWNKWQHSDINCLFQHTVVAEPFFQSIRWVPFLNVGKKKFLVRSQAARSSLELNVLRELSFSWRKASANEFQGMCICMRFPPGKIGLQIICVTLWLKLHRIEEIGSWIVRSLMMWWCWIWVSDQCSFSSWACHHVGSGRTQF